MLKKTIKYEDLDGNEVQDTFYFNMSEAELTKLRLKYDVQGGMEEYFQKALKAKDANIITEIFDGFILGSIGVKSEDNKRFEKKNGAIAEAFRETDAYSVLFQELLDNNGLNFQEFIKGVIPKRSKGRLNEKLSEAAGSALNSPAPFVDLPHNTPPGLKETIRAAEIKASTPTDIRPAWRREDRQPTQEEMLSMSPSEFGDYAEWRRRREIEKK